MLTAITQQPNLVAAQVWLDAAALRHQALAANLANAATPGYQRVDLAADFSATLSRQLATGSLGNGQNFPLRLEKDTTAHPTSPDGNNVSVEAELQEVNQNALRYQFTTQYLSSSFKHLQTAITGRVNPE